MPASAAGPLNLGLLKNEIGVGEATSASCGRDGLPAEGQVSLGRSEAGQLHVCIFRNKLGMMIFSPAVIFNAPIQDIYSAWLAERMRPNVHY